MWENIFLGNTKIPRCSIKIRKSNSFSTFQKVSWWVVLGMRWFMDTNWRVRFHKCFLLYFCHPISLHLPLFSAECPLTHLSIKRNCTTAVTSQKKTSISDTLEGNILHLTKAKKRTMFCLFKIPISWKIRGKQICYLEAIFTYLKIVVTSIKVARFQNFTQA